MSAENVLQLSGTPRDRLRQLDAILDDLEDLHLRELSNLPARTASALSDLGVADPHVHSVTELIDRVFELQEPVLAAVRSHSPLRRAMRSA